MRIMDTQEYLDNIIQILEQDTTVSIPVSGSSMCPFLHPGDLVYLEQPKKPLKKGDVVLFTRRNGQYVLHRICKVNPDGSYLMMGDNQQWREPVASAGQIHGIVTAMQRDGRTDKPGSLRWWFYAKLWLWAAPWRRRIIRLWGKLRGK